MDGKRAETTLEMLIWCSAGAGIVDGRLGFTIPAIFALPGEEKKSHELQLSLTSAHYCCFFLLCLSPVMAETIFNISKPHTPPTDQKGRAQVSPLHQQVL